MTIWYKVDTRFLDRIQSVKVDKATINYLYISEIKPFQFVPIYRKIRKHSETVDFFPTFEEAKEFLIELLEQKIILSKRETNKYRSFLGTVKKIKKEGYNNG